MAFRVTPRLFPRRRYPPGWEPRAHRSQAPDLDRPGQGPRRRGRPAPHATPGQAAWRKLAVGLGALVALAALVLFLLDVLLWPTLRTLAEAEVQNMAVAAMYQAVRDEVTAANLDYRRIFHVETNAAGQVTFMQPDTVAVNVFAARLALAVQAQLAGMDGRKVYIPLGRALGSRLLGWMGPRIGVKISPVVLQNVRIWDTFESAGINQTRHRIYVNVRLITKTVIPFIGSDLTVEGDFPVAEAVIVGQVPNTYVGGMWLPFYPRDGNGAAAPGGSGGSGTVAPGGATGP